MAARFSHSHSAQTDSREGVGRFSMISPDVFFGRSVKEALRSSEHPIDEGLAVEGDPSWCQRRTVVAFGEGQHEVGTVVVERHQE